MAVYTPVTDADLTAFLAGYGLPPAARFEGIAGGIENTNYRVWAGGRRLILTLYEGRTALGDLPYFLGLMAHVARAGASAAAPLTDLGGQTLGSLSGRPAALVTHLDGADIAEPGPDAAWAAGRALGALHLAARDFAQVRPNGFGPDEWARAAGALGADLDRLGPGVADEARGRAAALRARWPDLPRGTIHADLFPDNVLFADGDDRPRVSGIIDLYFACTDALAYDLAIAMAAWTPEGTGRPDPANAHAMRAGYEAVRPLRPAEVDALPRLMEGAAWRFFLTRAEDWLAPRDAIAGRAKDPLPFLTLARHMAADPRHLTEPA